MARMSAPRPDSATPSSFKYTPRLPPAANPQVAFNLRADDDGFAREMRLHVVAHFLNERVLIRRGEFGFLDVAGENDRLVGQQEETALDDFLVR